MPSLSLPSVLPRRAFLHYAVAAAATTTLAGCASPVPSPSIPISAVTPGVPQEKDRRKRTLVVASGYGRDQWNPYTSDNGHQNGSGLFFEPLFYYSAFANSLIPWLAEGYAFAPDYKRLTLTLRKTVQWSDGQPFTADDVAFTLNEFQHRASRVTRVANVLEFLDRARATDATTVDIDFKTPAPRFVMQLAYWYDNGIFIVPKHIFADQQNWTTFRYVDPVTTGPWRLGPNTPDRTQIERASTWWAVPSGVARSLPAVEHLVYVPFDPGNAAVELRSNEVDCSQELGTQTMRALLELNPSLSTYSGRRSPYGNVDWWPISLYVNVKKRGLEDARVRWALSYSIDRTRLVKDAFSGASEPAPLPLPSVTAYPGLKPYTDEIAPLLVARNTLEFNPARAEQLLAEARYAKNRDGLWSKDGSVLEIRVGVLDMFAELGLSVVRQLKEAGLSVTLLKNPEAMLEKNFHSGQYDLMLFGHGGSVGPDPYATLVLYQSKSKGHSRTRDSTWTDANYDQIVDEMASTPPSDVEKLKEQFRRAMDIWLTELPDIPLVEWYHRIPVNTAYWTGWPTQTDSYVNPAFWHLTFPLVLNHLQPAHVRAS